MNFRNVLLGAYTDQPTVYKLIFGKKYYIWKGKNLRHSVETICKDIGRFVTNGCNSDHLLKKVIDHVAKNRVMFCKVTVLLQTDNLTELIDFENLILKQSENDPDCLNVKFDAHIPKWILDPGHGDKSKTTQNKPITGTFSSGKVQTPASVDKIKPTRTESPVKTILPPPGKSKIMDALAKLKK